MSFGEVLARHRRAAGLSQADLAEAATLSLSYLRKLEQGSSEPSGLAIICQLADALGVDGRLLFGRRHLPEPSEHTLDLRGPTPMALVDSELVIVTASDEWCRVFPGTSPGASLAAWHFTDPRARLVVEDWRPIARGVAWWLSIANDLRHSDNLALTELPEYQRLARSSFESRNRYAVVAPGGFKLRDWDTRIVTSRTISVFSGQTSAGTLLTLSAPEPEL